LNVILNNSVKFLPKKYNCFFNTANSLIEDPILLHFASNPKPWSGIAHSNELYLRYYNNSPWGVIKLKKPIGYKEAKKYAKVLFKNKEYFCGIFWFGKYFFGKIFQ
ncbi:glycosyltransferase family 8 C-terminal domain-containing protein, partial [Xenorhabdus sp. PB30.3]|uniref:glycosyltransferase family 8 C-terminal domain-containing protein n=1 Tax=Xenorhabdus sp. PB30.3 TaxID=2788941 RepID=UPI00272C0A3D